MLIVERTHCLSLRLHFDLCFAINALFKKNIISILFTDFKVIH